MRVIAIKELYTKIRNSGYYPLFWISIAFLLIYSSWIVEIIRCPEGFIPNGFSGGGVDYLTYIGKMELGYRGHWMFHNIFTPEKVEPIHAYYYYLAIGHIAKWLGVSCLAVYKIVHSLITAVMLWLWWVVCKRQRFALICFLVGVFSFNIALIPVQLIDFITTGDGINLRAYTLAIFLSPILYSQMGFSHYALDCIGMILLYEVYKSGWNIKWSLLAGVLIGIAHPYLVFVVPGVCLVHSLIYNREKFKLALNISILSFIGASVFLVLLTIDFVTIDWMLAWRQQTGENNLVYWLSICTLGTGLISLFAWIGVKKALKSGNEDFELSAVWMLCITIIGIIVVPMMNGLREIGFFMSMPLTIVGVNRLFGNIEANKIITALILIVICGPYGYYCMQLNYFKDMKDTNFCVESKAFISGLKWIEEQSEDSDVALALTRTGIKIPLYVEKPRPYVAHICETMYAWERKFNCEELLLKPENIMVKDKASYEKVANEKLEDFEWIVIEQKDRNKLKENLPINIVYENEAVIIAKPKNRLVN